MKRGKILILILSFLILLSLLIPWRKVAVAPAVRVRVLDEAGNPAGNVIVAQEWEYRAVGSEEHKELVTADAQGYAAFPERTERISLAGQTLSVLREIVHLPHGYGIGSYVRVSAYGEDPHVWYFIYCTPNDSPCDVIRLKRWDTTMYP
jgi:hypothetical protein